MITMAAVPARREESCNELMMTGLVGFPILTTVTRCELQTMKARSPWTARPCAPSSIETLTIDPASVGADGLETSTLVKRALLDATVNTKLGAYGTTARDEHRSVSKWARAREAEKDHSSPSFSPAMPAAPSSQPVLLSTAPRRDGSEASPTETTVTRLALELLTYAWPPPGERATSEAPARLEALCSEPRISGADAIEMFMTVRDALQATTSRVSVAAMPPAPASTDGS